MPDERFLRFLRCLAVVFVVLTGNASCVTAPTTSSPGENNGNDTVAAATGVVHPGSSGSVNPTEASSHLTCADVQQIFAMKQIGTAEMVPDLAISGKGLEICVAESSCCTKQMETKYFAAVKQDFGSVLYSTSSSGRNMLATQASQLQENLLQLVQWSQNLTLSLFAEVYQRVFPQAREPVIRLFASLTSFLEGSEVDVEAEVGTFFDGLFPLVYHHTLNPKLQDFSADYKECLKETRPELKPFGDGPRRLATQLSKALHATRVLGQALSLGVEVLNTTSHASISSECQRALMRLLYCPHCRGLATVRPCQGYCVNVVRGCLASVAELDQPWADCLSAVDRLTLAMKGSYNPEEVFSQVHTRISEAIMHAMEDGPDLAQKVKKACGHPKRATEEVAPAEEHPVLAVPVAVRPASPSLYIRLQTLMKSLTSLKAFYSSLADSLCSDDSLSVRGESSCWNGNAIGQYSKTIVGIGLNAQKYNSEMQVSQQQDKNITKLIDKLKHVRKVLVNRITTIPESDSLLNDGSGSGWRHNNNFNNDDEDYDNDGSGYGSGDDGDRHPYTSHRTNSGRDKWKKGPPNTGTNDLSFEQSEDDHDNDVPTDYDSSPRSGKKSTKTEVHRTHAPGSSSKLVDSAAGIFLSMILTISVWMHV